MTVDDSHAGDVERSIRQSARGQRVVEGVAVAIALAVVFIISLVDHGTVTSAEATAARERSSIRATLKSQADELDKTLTQLAEVRAELEADRAILQKNGLPLAPSVTITNTSPTTTTTTTAPARPRGSSPTTAPSSPPGTTPPTTAPHPTPPTSGPPPSKPPITLPCVRGVTC